MYIHISTRTHIHAYIIHTTIAHTVTHSALITPLKAYCVGGSKCHALPLYTVKLTRTRTLVISPRMWLGQYEYYQAAIKSRLV